MGNSASVPSANAATAVLADTSNRAASGTTAAPAAAPSASVVTATPAAAAAAVPLPSNVIVPAATAAPAAAVPAVAPAAAAAPAPAAAPVASGATARASHENVAEAWIQRIPSRPLRMGDPLPMYDALAAAAPSSSAASSQSPAEGSKSIYRNALALASLTHEIDGSKHCLEKEQRAFVDARARCKAQRNQTFVCHGMYGTYAAQSEHVPANADEARSLDGSVAVAANYNAVSLDKSSRSLDRQLLMRQARHTRGARPTMLETAQQSLHKGDLGAPVRSEFEALLQYDGRLGGVGIAAASPAPLRPSQDDRDANVRAKARGGSDQLLLQQQKQRIQEHADDSAALIGHTPPLDVSASAAAAK